jgi:GNAT superfamily N-acetyltransferase
MIRVTALEPDDWQVARDVRLRSLLDAPDAFTASHRHEAAFDETTWRDRTRSGGWFVAFDDSAPVGTACGVDGWSVDGSERELVGMWVAPAHRQRGIARLLLEHVVGWARQQGATALTLGVREGNDSARRAYEQMGMQPTGRMVQAANDPSRRIEIFDRQLV